MPARPRSSPQPLLRLTPQGLYCAAGDFFIDPNRRVDRAIITHAHSDHARRGSGSYLTSQDGYYPLRTRMGGKAPINTAEYGEPVVINGVRVSLHPAGHILGSAQVRVEYGGDVWVVSGDYKIDADPTCRAYEPVRCHTFITESTFGLPVYHWPDQERVLAAMNAWWRSNRDRDLLSVVLGYSLGKSQRILAGLDPTIGPIFCHPSIQEMNNAYRMSGISLPDTLPVETVDNTTLPTGALVIVPPGSELLGRISFQQRVRIGVASGWMQIKRFRQRESADEAFVLSDHADWPGLNAAIRATEAQQVLVTHGYVDALVRWLNEQGLEASPLSVE